MKILIEFQSLWWWTETQWFLKIESRTVQKLRYEIELDSFLDVISVSEISKWFSVKVLVRFKLLLIFYDFFSFFLFICWILIFDPTSGGWVSLCAYFLKKCSITSIWFTFRVKLLLLLRHSSSSLYTWIYNKLGLLRNLHVEF